MEKVALSYVEWMHVALFFAVRDKSVTSLPIPDAERQYLKMKTSHSELFVLFAGCKYASYQQLNQNRITEIAKTYEKKIEKKMLCIMFLLLYN